MEDKTAIEVVEGIIEGIRKENHFEKAASLETHVRQALLMLSRQRKDWKLINELIN